MRSGLNEEGRGCITINGRRNIDTMSGFNKKYNNPQWLIVDEGGKRKEEGGGDDNYDHGN